MPADCKDHDPDFLRDLIRKIGQGNRPALRALYEATAPRLMGLCIVAFRDKSRAEELLRDTYVAVWRSARELKSSQKEPLAWLVSVLRREMLRQRESLVASAPKSKMDVGREVNDVIAHLPTDSAMRRRLSKLPKETAQAFILVYIYQYSYGELAEVMHIDSTTARDLVLDGLKVLNE